MTPNKHAWPYQAAAVALVAALLLAACQGASTATPAPATPTAEGENTLIVYNYPTYIDDAVLQQFEQLYQVKVNYITYDNSDDMSDEILAGKTAYDVLIAADYTIQTLRTANALLPLRKDNLPNIKNLDPAIMNQSFDPGNRYCLPYLWGTLGIGYNSATLGKEITSWAEVFDPALAGRVSMLDDSRAALGIALLALGYSPNSSEASEINAARDFLITQSNLIKVYASDEDGDTFLKDGEVDLAIEYNGDIVSLMVDNPDMRYVIPEEGALIWMDNMCIPASAPHRALAETFINFILDAKVGAAIANFTHYSTPNLAALPYINPDELANPAIYPTDEVRQRLYFIVDVSAAADQLYQQAWTQVRERHSP
jgi:spermidine/putrescine transport system substrate-binding protein